MYVIMQITRGACFGVNKNINFGEFSQLNINGNQVFEEFFAPSFFRV